MMIDKEILMVCTVFFYASLFMLNLRSHKQYNVCRFKMKNQFLTAVAEFIPTKKSITLTLHHGLTLKRVNLSERNSVLEKTSKTKNAWKGTLCYIKRYKEFNQKQASIVNRECLTNVESHHKAILHNRASQKPTQSLQLHTTVHC